MVCRRNIMLGLSLLVIWVTGCAGPNQPWNEPGEGLSEIQQLCSSNHSLDQVFDREHFITVEPDVTLHVIEKFSLRSILRYPRRAILMMPPTFVTNAFYDAQVEGDDSHNAMTRMAKAGFFAFSVTYEGYGLSTYPEDGRTVTFEKTLIQMGHLVEWIRNTRWVRKVDLMGGSMGSNLAVSLGGIESPINRRHIGRIVLSSVVYKEFSQFVLENFFTPGLQELMKSLPYIETLPEMYYLVMTAAEPEAIEWVSVTFPGVYATGPTLEGFDLPVSAAETGRAPALQAWGTHDPVNTPHDVELLQQEYGGPIELLVLEGGGHTPIFEPGRDIFWNRVLKFLRTKHCRKCHW